MLILNGSAECIAESNEQTLGNRYAFNMFSSNDNLDEQLAEIEQYLVSRGWDNIEITENGLIDNIEGIQHATLISAFKKAQSEGFSVVINNTLELK
ncbi:hypothetical protein [Cognaticolwellia mytili]|uniref:hypothetical protein n=1 Tax=Cognaticolwellia mytili TaxID=1888913 RepID=UPI000A178635|nr:hypothetical protein [Cognaticolwellia mytili]